MHASYDVKLSLNDTSTHVVTTDTPWGQFKSRISRLSAASIGLWKRSHHAVSYSPCMHDHTRALPGQVKATACLLLHTLLPACYEFYDPCCKGSLDPLCCVVLLPMLSSPSSSPASESCCIACFFIAFCLSHRLVWDMLIFSMLCWLYFRPSRACDNAVR